MGAVATAVSVLGTLYSGYSQYQAAQTEAANTRANAEAQAIAAKQNAEAQAAATRRNAETQAVLYQQNADLARDQAEANRLDEATQEDKLRDKLRRTRGAQTAAYGASGISTNTGSPLVVDEDTAVQGEEDIDVLRSNYARKSNSLRDQATIYEGRGSTALNTGEIDATNILNQGYAQAQNYLNQGYAQANAISSSGNYALGGSLISGAGIVANKWNTIMPTKNKTTTYTPTSNVSTKAYTPDAASSTVMPTMWRYEATDPYFQKTQGMGRDTRRINRRTY